MKLSSTCHYLKYVVWASLLLVVGCTPLQPSPTPTVTEIPVTQTPVPTLTATVTPIPSATQTPTASLTPQPTATSGPTFASLKLIAVTQSTNGVQLVFELPGVQTAYALMLNSVKYGCTVVVKVPDRLYCNGLKKPPVDKAIPLQFLNPEDDSLVYETNWNIPAAIVPTDIPVGDPSTWCEDRGKDIKCEYECRLDNSGKACMIASCYDACGYYFSVDSCPADLTAPFTPCDGQTLEEMKARYNIP